MIAERIRRRLELRRSNAAVPHLNKFRQRKSGQDPTDALNDVQQWLIDWEEGNEVYGDEWD